MKVLTSACARIIVVESERHGNRQSGWRGENAQELKCRFPVSLETRGSVSEWFKVQSWKDCVGE